MNGRHNGSGHRARRTAAALGCLMALGGMVVAGPALAGGRPLPFWSEPYPYHYVGTRAGCEALRPVETPYGIRYEKVWVCRRVLHARG